MKRVHNIRIRTIERDRALAKETIDALMSLAGIERKDVQITITDDEGLAVAEAWMEKQTPIRKLLALLNDKLPVEQKNKIAENPTRYLDMATHCFLRLDKDAFYNDKLSLKDAGECIHIRLNIAAFPATKENATAILASLFSQAQ